MRGRGTEAKLLAALAAILMAGACADQGDVTETSPSTTPSEPPPEPSLEQLSLSVELDTPFHAVGDTVLALKASDAPELMASTDLGDTWEEAELPAAPDGSTFSYTSLEVIDDLAVVAGEVEGDEDQDSPDDASRFTVDEIYLWLGAAGTDGVDWKGGHLPVTHRTSTLTDPVPAVAGDGSVVAGVITTFDTGDDLYDGVELFHSADAGEPWTPADMPEVTIDGAQTRFETIWPDPSPPEGEDRLVAVVMSDSSDDKLTVLESTDGGRSWQVGTCPEDYAVDDDCHLPDGSGPIETGPEGVSVNGGPWQEPVLEPPSASGDPDTFTPQDVVELPDDGLLTWVDIEIDMDNTFGVLARSDDGVTWQQLLNDQPCTGDLNPRYRQPVPLGGGWLVARACRETQESGGSPMVVAGSDLFVLDAAATEPVAIEDADLEGQESLEPTSVEGVVLVPVAAPEDDTGVADELLRLTP